MDPENPVVKLCVAGMTAEGAGRLDEARSCYEQAWARRNDDYEGCIAAHYLARHQDTPADTHHWNLTALRLAEMLTDDAADGFRPSLHLNVASSHEQLGDHLAARAHLAKAEAHLTELPEGSYKDVVRRGIDNVGARLASAVGRLARR
jgi:tetratricopeptide (TPR) repeat protein